MNRLAGFSLFFHRFGIAATTPARTRAFGAESSDQLNLGSSHF
jgi:hypothetical protein